MCAAAVGERGCVAVGWRWGVAVGWRWGVAVEGGGGRSVVVSLLHTTLRSVEIRDTYLGVLYTCIYMTVHDCLRE